jgi:hypothetical protein
MGKQSNDNNRLQQDNQESSHDLRVWSFKHFGTVEYNLTWMHAHEVGMLLRLALEVP